MRDVGEQRRSMENRREGKGGIWRLTLVCDVMASLRLVGRGATPSFLTSGSRCQNVRLHRWPGMHPR